MRRPQWAASLVVHVSLGRGGHECEGCRTSHITRTVVCAVRTVALCRHQLLRIAGACLASGESAAFPQPVCGKRRRFAVGLAPLCKARACPGEAGAGVSRVQLCVLFSVGWRMTLTADAAAVPCAACARPTNQRRWWLRSPASAREAPPCRPHRHSASLQGEAGPRPNATNSHRHRLAAAASPPGRLGLFTTSAAPPLVSGSPLVPWASCRVPMQRPFGCSLHPPAISLAAALAVPPPMRPD